MNKKHYVIFFFSLFFLIFIESSSDEKNRLSYTCSFGNIVHTPSIEDHIKQFRSDMKQIEKQEIEEMVRVVRKKLRNLEEHEGLDDLDKTNQIIRSSVADYICEKISQEAKRYTKDEQILGRIQEFVEMRVITQLEKITGNLNGRALKQFFGKEREDMLVYALTFVYSLQQSDNAHSYQINCDTNNMPVPPAPLVFQNNSDYYIKQHQAKIAQELKSSLLTKDVTINDFERLNNGVAESVTCFTHIEPDDFIAHTRYALTQMLDENLEQCRKDLLNGHLDQNYLLQSVNETRDRIMIAIEKLRCFNKDILFSLLEKNLKEEIIFNYFCAIDQKNHIKK